MYTALMRTIPSLSGAVAFNLVCNGIDTCECFDEDILENCERFEPDPEVMRELWNHELDANTREAGEAENIIYRYEAKFSFFWISKLQVTTTLGFILGYWIFNVKFPVRESL
jgi:hypothetical protein